MGFIAYAIPNMAKRVSRNLSLAHGQR